MLGQAFPPKERVVLCTALGQVSGETGDDVGMVRCEIVFVWVGEVMRGRALVMPSVRKDGRYDYAILS